MAQEPVGQAALSDDVIPAAQPDSRHTPNDRSLK
jgi:hypothetical protein